MTVQVMGTESEDAMHNPIYSPLPGAIVTVDAESHVSDIDGFATFLVPRPYIAYAGQEHRVYGVASMHGYTPRISGSWSVYDTASRSYPTIQVQLSKDLTTARGSILATVTDATTGTPVEGASVVIVAEGSSGVSDASGNVTFGDMSPGKYTLVASKTGQPSATARGIEVLADQLAHASLVMATPINVGQFRFVLSWDVVPRDLDLHLTIPADSAHTGYEIYYSNHGTADAYPYAELDHDVTSGRGPETITIHRPLDGRYRSEEHTSELQSQR